MLKLNDYSLKLFYTCTMLNQLQKEAADLAISGHTTVINGPAGTGKTYTKKEFNPNSLPLVNL